MHNLLKVNIILLIGTLLGCSPPDLNTTITDDRFSLKTFIEGEVERVKDQDLVLEKQMIQNGKEEISTESTKEWVSLLEFFGKSDFNKPAYSGLYSMDSINMEGYMVIQYTALEEGMNPNQFNVHYQSDKLTEIHYTRLEKNFLFEIEEKRSLVVDQTIIIDRKQSIRFLSPTETTIRAQLTESGT